jgi:DNA-binding Lrp family transcriptional regulator
MEALDLQIVQCLLRDGRAPFRRIAAALGVSEQTVARRYRGLLADGALRVQVQPDERVTGQQRWFVRVQCRPDAAAALADSMAARGDVSWVSITSGGSEIICVTFSDPSLDDASVLARLPRTHQVLSLTAFRRPAHAPRQQRSQVDALRRASHPRSDRRAARRDRADVRRQYRDSAGDPPG